MPQSREQVLARMAACLNTPDGVLLMKELEALWDSYSLLGDSPQMTGHSVGLRDAYKYLKQLSDGDFKDE